MHLCFVHTAEICLNYSSPKNLTHKTTHSALYFTTVYIYIYIYICLCREREIWYYKITKSKNTCINTKKRDPFTMTQLKFVVVDMQPHTAIQLFINHCLIWKHSNFLLSFIPFSPSYSYKDLISCSCTSHPVTVCVCFIL